MCLAYAKDFPIATRIARYHNVYGPRGTWKGGREKAPAAFCRKAICSTSEFEMWGDGLQTRSFMFIDDCVEGSIRIMLSEHCQPLNLGKHLDTIRYDMTPYYMTLPCYSCEVLMCI